MKTIPESVKIHAIYEMLHGAMSGREKEIERFMVVIKKPSNLSVWENTAIGLTMQTNKELVYREDTKNNLLFVDLFRIPSDDYNLIKADWIKQNAQRIEYTRTGMATEMAHRINFPEAIEAIYPEPVKPSIPPTSKPATIWYAEIAVEDLRTIINNRILAIDLLKPNPQPTGHDFYAQDMYDYYVEFYIDAAGNLDVNPIEKFTNIKLLFSIPMLRSIVKTHGLGDLDNLGIGMVTFGRTFPFLYVSLTDEKKFYYDFSNEPR